MEREGRMLGCLISINRSKKTGILEPHIKIMVIRKWEDSRWFYFLFSSLFFHGMAIKYYLNNKNNKIRFFFWLRDTFGHVHWDIEVSNIHISPVLTPFRGARCSPALNNRLSVERQSGCRVFYLNQNYSMLTSVPWPFSCLILLISH